MSRATPDDQVRFLISCVKHSNNGRVDFVQVAKECDVVSKGAAAKRYERLVKANAAANDTTDAAATHTLGPGPSSAISVVVPKPVKQKANDGSEKPSAAKKRKLERKLSTGRPSEDTKRPKPTLPIKNIHPQSPRPAVMQPEGFKSMPQTQTPGSLPLRHGAPATFITGPPPTAHGLPTYPAHHRPTFTGYATYGPVPGGHQLVPDMSMYPPFPQAGFMDPWSTPLPMPAQDHVFDEYIRPDYTNEHNHVGPQAPPIETLPLRVPPPPQELMPAVKPKESASAQGGKPKEKVVIVE